MKSKHSIFAITVVMLLSMVTSYATPYWTEAELEAARLENDATSFPRNVETAYRERPSSLDEIAYFVKYRQLCDFLVGLQVTQAGQNFGGMREGEVGADFTIIQTDNTQEAIRVWSQYAVWTGDTALYGQNIRDAWVYNARWPAWREEGGGYYAMHNCGWGFEAAYKYREAYGDTSKNWYADSCAWWVMANPLALNTTVNVAAQGLGIGGMYPHAVYRGRNDWRNATLSRARAIRNWFEAQPSRLNNALEWALCGGTALWGVCNSLWIEYPDSGATWVNQYGSQLETWEVPSSWHNAYNTWYSNATFRCWELTGDSLFWRRGVFYADSLVGFDVDDDGGIPPGTCCIGQGNDHSWVSAYMGWMGLERIISSGPIIIAEARGVSFPDSTLPLLEGDTTEVRVRIANLGTDTVNTRLTVTGDNNYIEIAVQTLSPGAISDIDLNAHWVLPLVDDLNGDDLEMRVVLQYWSNEQPEDTFTHERVTTLNLRRRTNVYGSIVGALDQGSIPCHIDFYSEDYPDSIWTSVDVGIGVFYTNGSRPLLEGNNFAIITPPARYLIREQHFVTLAENTDPLDHTLTPTEVLLVDDDSGEDYETYITSSLRQNGDSARVWDRQALELEDLSQVPWLIWMTGDDSVSSLTATDQQALTNYLSGGGRVLVTGQNISDDEQTESFLRDVFYCTPDRDDTGILRAYGIGGAPDVEDQFLLLLGTQGAGNQSSPSSILPLNNATALFINDTLTEEICGVYGEYNSGRFIYLSFGLEAVSGQAGSTSRAVFLEAARDWLTETVGVSPSFPNVVSQFELLPSYPNPFNGQVQISWLAPQGNLQSTVQVYDLLGRRVATLHHGQSLAGRNSVNWNGTEQNGIPVASGTYLIRLTTDVSRLSQTIRYIR